MTKQKREARKSSDDDPFKPNKPKRFFLKLIGKPYKRPPQHVIDEYYEKLGEELKETFKKLFGNGKKGKKGFEVRRSIRSSI